jgi:hypothetical protein
MCELERDSMREAFASFFWSRRRVTLHDQVPTGWTHTLDEGHPEAPRQWFRPHGSWRFAAVLCVCTPNRRQGRPTTALVGPWQIKTLDNWDPVGAILLSSRPGLLFPRRQVRVSGPISSQLGIVSTAPPFGCDAFVEPRARTYVLAYSRSLLLLVVFMFQIK